MKTAMRRIIDVVFTLVVLPILTPLFGLVMLAVVIESPGNPFYGGWRIGKGGRRFRMWKFRTMVKNADRVGTAITTRRDPRITKVGWFLRATKIDELPQFINLLVGDLTLIGPRPEAPEFVEQYTKEQREILKVKPGITGPTQLHYTVLEAETVPDGQDAERFYVEQVMDKKLRLDLEYIEKRTFFSDCRVVLETISLMVRALAESVSR
jgi:lipopolysaccharide/colanic/teichoic acid biosynthesis glycosyltransferase